MSELSTDDEIKQILSDPIMNDQSDFGYISNHSTLSRLKRLYEARKRGPEFTVGSYFYLTSQKVVVKIIKIDGLCYKFAKADGTRFEMKPSFNKSPEWVDFNLEDAELRYLTEEEKVEYL